MTWDISPRVNPRGVTDSQAELKSADVTYDKLAQRLEKVRIRGDQGEHREQVGACDVERAFFAREPGGHPSQSHSLLGGDHLATELLRLPLRLRRASLLSRIGAAL